MEVYKHLVGPFLDKQDSETWHRKAREALHFAEEVPFGLGLKFLEQFSYGRSRFTSTRLETTITGIHFNNTTMAGAGWDKYGVAIQGLYTLGAGGVEVGAVLVAGQDGNDKPRQWANRRVADNALGFNGPGMYEVYNNLLRYRDLNIPIGINIGKNKEVPDQYAPFVYSWVVKRFKGIASYFGINVSSPNTPGLRGLAGKEPLTDIIQACKEEAVDEKGQEIPIFVKVSPDSDDYTNNDIIQIGYDHNLAGFIIANTTVDSELKALYGWENLPGGLSGDNAEYRARLNRQTAKYRKAVGKGKIIIGVGAINNFQTALERHLAGSDLNQIVTSIRTEGPTVFGRINQGLDYWLETHGVKNISEIVGQEADKMVGVFPPTRPYSGFWGHPDELENLATSGTTVLTDRVLESSFKIMDRKIYSDAALPGDFLFLEDEETHVIVRVDKIENIRGKKGNIRVSFIREFTPDELKPSGR